MREVVTSTDILTFFRTQSFERLARLVITISADDACKYFIFVVSLEMKGKNQSHVAVRYLK
jgi:hypothetical protein